MNCHECQPLLSAYVDQSVRADDRVTVERHLRTCAQCRALADDFAAIRDAAGSLEPLVPPAHVWRQLSATAAAAQPPRVRFGWVGWRPLSATAMAVMIAASLWRVGTLLQPAATTSAPTQLARVDDANADSDPETHYTVAIAQLEEVARADRDVLDAVGSDVADPRDRITEFESTLAFRIGDRANHRTIRSREHEGFVRARCTDHEIGYPVGIDVADARDRRVAP